MRKIIGFLLAVVMLFGLVGCFSACSGGADKNSFTYFLYGGNVKYDTNLEQNAYLQWLLHDTWGEDEDKLSLEVQIPSKSSSASETMGALLTSGDYPDIIDGNALQSWTLDELYADGVIMDITEYVEQYMPNYLKYIEDNPEFEPVATREIDGKKRYVSLYCFGDAFEPNCWAYSYRRDWIVKYGKHPVTGAGFSGGFDANGDWSDDVIFPNGTNLPIYLSDWEWMFDIFEVARKDLALTEDPDSYCITIPYSGNDMIGGLCGAFNVNCSFFIDNDGVADFGADDEKMRVYYSAMNNWYNQGWLDKSFYERSNDAAYSINMSAVAAGKVGMWFGQIAFLCDVLKDSSSPYLDGAYVMAARPPLNDIYGKGTAACYDASTNDYHNNNLYCYSKISASICISTAAADKNLPALFEMLDSTYTEETAMIRVKGLTAEQQEILQNPFYIEHGITDAWEYSTDDEGNPLYNADGNQYVNILEEILVDEYLKIAVIGIRFWGRSILSTDYIPRRDWDQISYEEIMNFEGSGFLQNDVIMQLKSDELAYYNDISTWVRNTSEPVTYKYVTGELDATDDADWQVWLSSFDKEYKDGVTYGEAIEKIQAALNGILGN